MIINPPILSEYITVCQKSQAKALWAILDFVDDRFDEEK